MKIRNLLFIWSTVVLTGCASAPQAPPYEVVTPAAKCEEQGGCVVISRGHVLHLMGQAHLEGGQTCLRSGT